MPIRSKQFWAKYVALDSDYNPLAGDLANHTINWTRDNTRAQATNNQGGAGKHVELGNGLYNILITVAETACDSGGIDGTSATPGAVIVPVSYVFDTSEWDLLVADHDISASFGKAVGQKLDVAVSTRSTYAGADTSGTTTLLARILGTLAAGTHNPQSGDSYAVVTNVTYGNSAIRTRGDAAWTTATSTTVSDKTGFKLASDGLDTIPVTAPAGVAATFREMMVAVWRSIFKKSTLNSEYLKTYADNNTTIMTTQAVSDDGITETREAAT